jgi:hypothetical protein
MNNDIDNKIKDVERTLFGIQLFFAYGAWYSFWATWYMFWYIVVPSIVIVIIWVLVIMLTGGGN